jgi:hypothetical protein
MRDGKRSVPQAGGSRGMDVRTEACCGQEARTYPASEFSYPGFRSAGVCCFQVVKTAQSRGRTERTLLFAGALAGRSTASPRYAGAGGTGGMPWTGLTRHFRCHITVCYTQLITPTSANELPVVGGRCTGGAHRCKVKQGCREDRADIWILASKVVRFGGRVQS